VLRLALVLLAALAAAGCQSQKMVWTKEGATKADLDTDTFNCLKRMHESGVSEFTFVDPMNDRGVSSGGPAGSRYVKNCLIARGWTPNFVNR